MKDILTVKEKARLKKTGVTSVRSEPACPLPPEFNRKYAGYVSAYRMVGQMIKKDFNGTGVPSGYPTGRVLVAIALPGLLQKLLKLVRSWPDFKNRKIILDIVRSSLTKPFVASISR